jgi:hypothetical protein
MKGLKKMARTHLNIFVRFFGSSGSFWALSTLETMSGRLRTAPKPPPKPSYALEGFYRCRRSCRSGRFSHQNHWKWSDGCAQVYVFGQLVHKRCASRRMQLMLLKQHLDNTTINLFMNVEHRGSCMEAIDEKNKEEGPYIIMFNWNWWTVVDRLGANNTTTNHHINSRGNRSSFCLERQWKGQQTHDNPPNERAWCVQNYLCCLCNYM